MPRNLGIGTKSIYLPKFTVALIRTPERKANPFIARFHVPLNFGKLDLRDYLRNLYNVRVRKIRSWVVQGKVTQERKKFGPEKDLFITEQLRRRRLPNEKFMEVDLEQPFVWPTPPLRSVEDQLPYELKWGETIHDVNSKPVRLRVEAAREQVKEWQQKLEESVANTKAAGRGEPYKEALLRQREAREALEKVKSTLEEDSHLLRLMDGLIPTDPKSKGRMNTVEYDLSAWGGQIPEDANEVDQKELGDKKKTWKQEQYEALKSGATRWRPTWQELQR